MDRDQIENLREALTFSPDNIPLRIHLAETLLAHNLLEEAEKEFELIVKKSEDERGRRGLAKVFYRQGAYAKCNVLLEELLRSFGDDLELLVLHSRALLKEGEIGPAMEAYQSVLELDPSFQDEELDDELRQGVHVTDMPDTFSPFVEAPEETFDDVGGMSDVKKEIELKIIRPLQHPELYKSYGKKIGGGILLYGPPGCGKTFIAKATAGQVQARFITVGLNDILDMWTGNSEKNLHALFEVAREHTPCVLFFDEIDALGASRSDMKQSSGRHLINQFLQELDGMESKNEGVLILGATNTPWHLDTAFRRPGRFDRIIFVPPPDEAAREEVFRLKLKNKPSEDLDFASMAKKTKDFSGADIEAVIDIAIEEKLSQSFEDGIPRPLQTKDLLKAIKKHAASTKEWFSTAKNFGLYANDSGLYDDILNYMNIKKK